MDIEFRTVHPDGLLFYVAETTAANPTAYFAVFIWDGYLVLSMQSDSPESRQDDSITKLLQSRQRYNDGEWWEVRAEI